MDWKVSEKRIDNLMEASEYEVHDCFGCCTVVVMRMPNGYVLVESSGCVDPNQYDHDLGVQYCMNALKRRAWQLEGYLRKQQYHESSSSDGYAEITD